MVGHIAAHLAVSTRPGRQQSSDSTARQRIKSSKQHQGRKKTEMERWRVVCWFVFCVSGNERQKRGERDEGATLFVVRPIDREKVVGETREELGKGSGQRDTKT